MIQSKHEQFTAAIDMEWEASNGPMAFSQLILHASAALTGNMTITLESGGVEYELSAFVPGTDTRQTFDPPVLMSRDDKITVVHANGGSATVDIILRGLDRAGFNY